MTIPLGYPGEDQIRWLFAQGVPDTAILEPEPIRAGKVRFLDRLTFDFDSDGERALIFRHDHDLIAWQPKRELLASWRGVAFAINEDAIWNPASWFAESALRIHRTPLQWLQANRDGIVIVQPRLACAMLHHVPRLAFADTAHARQIRLAMQPPKLCCEFLVEQSAMERRAA